MLKYVLFLVLLNQYSGSGSPMRTDIHLGKLLLELSKHCQYSFISKQIMSKLEECNMNISQYNNTHEIKCYSFYDINNRLCNTVNLSLVEDTRTNEQINISVICKDALSWRTDTELHAYKFLFHKIFGSTTHCAEVCKLADQVTDDSSFFCKYYNWGFHLLNDSINVQVESNKSNNSVNFINVSHIEQEKPFVDNKVIVKPEEIEPAKIISDKILPNDNEKSVSIKESIHDQLFQAPRADFIEHSSVPTQNMEKPVILESTILKTENALQDKMEDNKIDIAQNPKIGQEGLAKNDNLKEKVINNVQENADEIKLMKNIQENAVDNKKINIVQENLAENKIMHNVQENVAENRIMIDAQDKAAENVDTKGTHEKVCK